jgi:pyruvate dehydrogenase E1 component beta subunit
VVFIETVACYGIRGEVPVGDHVVELGKADIKRSGSDVTVVTYGRAVFDALQAAEHLAAEGIDVEVLDLRTLVPLDMETVLESVGRTGRAVVAHYATEFAGPGAELSAQIGAQLFGRLKAPVARVGARFRPIPAAKALEAQVFPNADRIAAAARTAVEYGR